MAVLARLRSPRLWEPSFTLEVNREHFRLFLEIASRPGNDRQVFLPASRKWLSAVLALLMHVGIGVERGMSGPLHIDILRMARELRDMAIHLIAHIDRDSAESRCQIALAKSAIDRFSGLGQQEMPGLRSTEDDAVTFRANSTSERC
jgi:hypothetical protein